MGHLFLQQRPPLSSSLQVLPPLPIPPYLRNFLIVLVDIFCSWTVRMNKSLQMSTSRPQSILCDPDGSVHVNNNQSIVIPTKCVVLAERFEKKEKSWYPTSHIPTDITIQIQDITFYVHKYPLVSKCEYMNRLDLRSPNSSTSSEIKLENFPGGAEAFEIILKFCYGLPVDLTPSNVAPLRCASEFLQMTEEREEGNLIAKSEAFLTFVVLSSWRDSITVMRSCESLSPWADNFQIIRRCSNSIASKITRKNSLSSETANDERWWLEDVSTLRMDHFVRIVTAVRAKGCKPEMIGACIMHYAEKWLPADDMNVTGTDQSLKVSPPHSYVKNELQLSILSGRREERSLGHNKEYRMMIEVLVSVLPPQIEAVSCKFLLWMLKMALMYSATPALVSELEKRIGIVLKEANVDDLLIPNCRTTAYEGKMGSPPAEDNTMHDVDVVQRIVDYFLMHEQQQQQQQCGKLHVGKLIDAYLAEIAGDPHLSISTFQVLAEALPDNARTCHDGLYRAIDTYLKTHPSITEHDRRRLCKAMDCDKLSLDACMHAAQNERLPLRTIIQVTINYKVLVSEQVKMRTTMNMKEKESNISSEITSMEQEGNTWSSTNTKKEIENIKTELEKVKTKMVELQNEHSELLQEFDKLNKHKFASAWISKWKKIKNSTFFHGKMNNHDIGEIRPTTTIDGRPRRQSIS